MLIMVAGPYSAETARERRENLEAMNRALPVVAQSKVLDEYEAIMKISLALADACDAILMIGESPGANREQAVLEAKGRPVYSALNEIPVNQ